MTALTLWLGSLSARHSMFPFDTDEAAHANAGLELALDLRAWNVVGFLGDSYRQNYYPPVFGWLEAGVFLVLGPSTTAARWASLLSAVLSVPVLFVLAGTLPPHRRGPVAAIALALTFANGTVLNLASLAMLEMPGILVTAVAFYLYLRSGDGVSSVRLIPAGIAMAVVFLTKYPFGLTSACAIVASEALGGLAEGNPAKAVQRAVRLFGPFVFVVMVWLAGNWDGFWVYAAAQPSTTPLWSWENLVFYPRAFVREYSPSFAWAVFSGVALCRAAWGWRDRATRLFALYVAATLAMVTLETQNSSRFVVTAVPFVHLLGGAFVVTLWEQLRRSGRRWALAPLFAIAAMAVGSLPGVVQPLLSHVRQLPDAFETDPELMRLAQWIAEETRGAPPLLVNAWDQFSDQALTWTLGKDAFGTGHRLGAYRVHAIELARLDNESMERLLDAAQRVGTRHVVVLEREGGPSLANLQDHSPVLVPRGTREVLISSAAAGGDGERATSVRLKASVYEWQRD